MNKKAKKISRKTLILLAVAVVMFCAGGVMTARAQLGIFSSDINSEFGMDDIDVVLTENGAQVNTEGDEDAGRLMADLEGEILPGRSYDEKIAAENKGAADEYVRIRITKYWKNAKGKKNAKLDPSLIELTYGDSSYNSGAWQRNKAESTTESETYYYSRKLSPGSATEPLMSRFRISDRVTSEEDGNYKVTEKKVGNKTVYTYEYIYDGYRACVEADVQSIQTHNGNDAIESLWGVTNVKSSDGGLVVQ